MISLANFSLIWSGRSPRLPLMWKNESSGVFDDKLTSLMKTNSSVGDDDRPLMEYWHIWKALDHVCWIHNFWAAVLFAVYFFAYYFLSCSRPAVCIALLYQQWVRQPNPNQGSSWWLHHYPISPSFAAVLSYILSSLLEYGWWFIASKRHTVQLRG